MIKGVARAIVKPGNKSRFMELAREFVTLNRSESGNISYKLYESRENPNILTFIEEWADAAALERHLQSEHFLRIAPLLAKLQEGPTLADTYTDTNL